MPPPHHYHQQQQQQQQVSRSFRPNPFAISAIPGYSAGPSRLHEMTRLHPAQQQQQQQQQQSAGHSRPHSWSGPSDSGSIADSLLPARSSNSFPLSSSQQERLQQQLELAQHLNPAPEPWQEEANLLPLPLLPQQQQQQQQQQQRLFHTVTTSGPAVSQLPMQRSGSEPIWSTGHRQQLPQPQLPGYQQPHAAPLQQQQQQPSLLPAVLPMEGPSEVMVFDDELVDILERTLSQQEQQQRQRQLSTQASEPMPLSPLPSIPSAGADMAAAAAAVAAGADWQAGSMQQLPLMQQQQQPALMPPAVDASGAAPPPAAANLLLSSQQLQSRHESAGFVPPTAPGEHFYIHHLVDWYR
jgi:hypothetical protein